MEFCEKRLMGLAPESRALRKDKPAATASSFTAEEWERIDSDIKVECGPVPGSVCTTENLAFFLSVVTS